MNSANKLFIISTIYVPLMLILMFYPQIHDFYTYSAPLNHFVVERGVYSDDPEIFSKTQSKEGTTCFTTSENLFCYEKPRMYERTGISYVRSAEGIDGELHLERTDNENSYFTMKKIVPVHGDTAQITFADKDYRRGNSERTDYEITDKFEFTVTVEKYDTFITTCSNYEGTSADLVQYLGITTIDDIEYFMTWHTLISSDRGISCDYPQIIKTSLRHDFGI